MAKKLILCLVGSIARILKLQEKEESKEATRKKHKTGKKESETKVFGSDGAL